MSALVTTLSVARIAKSSLLSRRHPTRVPFSTWSTAAELDFLLRDAKVDVLFAMARQGDRDFAADLAGLHAADPHVLPRRVVLLDSAALQGAPFESYARFAEGPPLGELPPGTSASAADPMVTPVRNVRVRSGENAT